MSEEEKQKCMVCLYTIIMAAAIVISTFYLPQIDRLAVRDYAGVITAVGSASGALMCGFFSWKMSQGRTRLNSRLKEVFYMLFIVFMLTAAFGVLGVVKPPLETWDVIYNIRAVAIVLLPIALSRFFWLWWKIGHR